LFPLPLETMPANETVTLALPDGVTMEAPARWRGRALAVHAPVNHVRDGKQTRGLWVVTGHVHGLSAGMFRGPLRDAIALARLWDDAFAAALPETRVTAPSLSRWEHAQQWLRQLSGDEPATGPGPSAETIRTRERVAAVDGDGAEQFPATVTLWPVTVRGERRIRLARRLANGRERLRNPETGEPLRMDGDVASFKGPDPLTPVFRLLWCGVWVDVPTTAELMEWSLDGVAETPTGARVEPDAPNSWLSLLGII
jgi:hypothetical protein